MLYVFQGGLNILHATKRKFLSINSINGSSYQFNFILNALFFRKEAVFFCQLFDFGLQKLDSFLEVK